VNESSPLASPTDPLIGRQIDGRYLIISLLGSGASGRVYKAKHILLDGFVAIKLLSASLLPSESDVQRFQKEAAVLNSLLHPNIVKFLAFGNADKLGHYMVLEFIEGETLAARLQRCRIFSTEQASAIFLDICSALEFAHSHGVLHRDLKPANIILVSDAEVHAKLLDFGIFKDMGSHSQNLTKTGTLLGSANYMSPEQCRSEKLDLRSDIYSMGCVMYETLAGTAPMHDDNELVVMQNHLNKQIKDVPAKHGISRELQRVILCCLEKNKEQRFASAAELKSALKAALQAPVLTRSRLANVLKWSAILVVVLLAVAVASAGVSSLLEKQTTAKSVFVSTGALRRRNKVPETPESVDGCNELKAFILEYIDDEKFDSGTLASAFCELTNKSIPLGVTVPKDLGDKIVARLQSSLAKKKSLPFRRQIDCYELIADMQSRLHEYRNAIATRIKLLERWPDEDKDYHENRVCSQIIQIAEQYDQLGDENNVLLYVHKGLKQAIKRDDVPEIINAYVSLAEHSGTRDQDRFYVMKCYDFTMKRLAEKGDLEPKNITRLIQRMNFIGECQSVVNLVQAFGQRIELSATKHRFLSDAKIGRSGEEKSDEYMHSAGLLYQEALAYMQMHKLKKAERILRMVLKFFDENNLHKAQYADFDCELLAILNEEKRYDEIPPLVSGLLQTMRNEPGDAYVMTLIKLLDVSQNFSKGMGDKLGLADKIREADQKYNHVCPKPCEQMMESLDALEHPTESINSQLKSTLGIKEEKHVYH